MARNIEIKARLDRHGGVDGVLPRARAVAGGAPELIEQDDCFYAVPHGRLKLRRFADGSAELIHYHRPDGTEARASDYVRVPLPDRAAADALHAALERSVGADATARVHKRRLLLMKGATRVHLDRVEGLGDFMELEVVLGEAQTDDDGRHVAEALMRELGLADAERVPVAYVDLLRRPT